MSTPTNQRFVLDLLETGKIDTNEANWLLEKIGGRSRHPESRRTATPYQPFHNNKVVLEIDADEENLQTVMKKLSEAICNHRTPDKKHPIFQRLARRNKSTTG
jgi:hypothetical protein